MEQLMMMKEQLIAAIQNQMGNLHQVDTKELGEAIDMVKDLSEAIYYCTVTEAMEEKDKEKEHMMYYPPIAYYTERIREPYYPERDIDRERNRMYYSDGQGGHSTAGGENTSYTASSANSDGGKSGSQRRTYMEARKYHTDKSMHMKELEKYISELGQDLTEMISGASPEEKQLLQRKLTMLANKVTDA